MGYDGQGLALTMFFLQSRQACLPCRMIPEWTISTRYDNLASCPRHQETDLVGGHLENATSLSVPPDRCPLADRDKTARLR